MMNDSSGFRQAEGLAGNVHDGAPAKAGLCARCAHAQVITSSRGSRFYLCGLSAVDERFPKYPRLPVLECAGFREAGDEDADGRPSAK